MGRLTIVATAQGRAAANLRPRAGKRYGCLSSKGSCLKSRVQNSLSTSRTHRGGATVVANGKEPSRERSDIPVSGQIELRSEAEAPFRVFRIACWIALGASAGLGGLIASVRVAAGLAKGEIGLTFADFLGSEDVTGLCIDLVALFVLVSLYKRDTGARDKQIKRLQRETSLSQLKVEINVRKPRLVTLQQIQGFARTVVVAGSRDYVVASVEAAAQVVDEIKDRSICIIPLVLSGGDQVDMSDIISDPEVLLRPILINEWRAWLGEQMKDAGVDLGVDVYIGLRMDGRVRASGKGVLPPWKKFIAELTPKEGIWASDFMKGFDGRMSGFD